MARRFEFKKVLVANRGEIAVRVIRACGELGFPTVAVYSEADREAKHVRLADDACAIGPAPAAESYLDIDRVLDAARRTGADAIHPGYGFLSENADFAEACRDRGFKFIGPPPAAIRSMGVKTRARELMDAAGVPVVPGSDGPVADAADAAPVGESIGFPVMLKAAAGGGGKGMRLVGSAEDLPAAWSEARGEARQSFGDDTIYLEKAIVRPRHVEVQVMADEHGRIVHLGERECSLQRRHQKVLEETPSPFVERHPEIREPLCDAAIRAAKAVSYTNAGTVEFLVDPDGRFYFLEMNTRLQVEHPVTELVTGTDLVREQILVATGLPLLWNQREVQSRGHAMECRIYAEDPEANFMPSPGRIERLRWPQGPGIRVDSGADEGWTVPVEYDALIAKLCAWAPHRGAAIQRLRQALRESTIAGIATTLGFFRDLLADSRFLRGAYDTGFLERGLETKAGMSTEARTAAMLAAVSALGGRAATRTAPPSEPSRWKARGRAAMLDRRGSVT